MPSKLPNGSYWQLSFKDANTYGINKLSPVLNRHFRNWSWTRVWHIGSWTSLIKQIIISIIPSECDCDPINYAISGKLTVKTWQLNEWLIIWSLGPLIFQICYAGGSLPLNTIPYFYGIHGRTCYGLHRIVLNSILSTRSLNLCKTITSELLYLIQSTLTRCHIISRLVKSLAFQHGFGHASHCHWSRHMSSSNL